MALTLLPIVVSPGASFTLALKQVFSGHPTGPLQVAAGTSLGVLTLAVIVGFTGLGHAVTAQPILMRVLSTLGGAVLVFMGVSAFKANPTNQETPSRRPPRYLALVSYVTLLSNPRALTVYLLIAPKTMHTPDCIGYLAFAGVHATLLFAWLGGLTYVAIRWPTIAANQSWRRWLLRGTAMYLIALGITVIV